VSDPVTALVDRQAVVDVLYRYATALDTRDWDLLRTCFVPAAVCDFGELGGVNEGTEAIVETIRSALEPFSVTQHIVTNVVVDLAGDAARSTCHHQGQHVFAGEDRSWFVGGTYRDRLVRSRDGWRIEHRALEPTWTREDRAVAAVR
jgi:3-phenylpropionate/cinnamic acid dioxygenase small subunit